jgi:peroxiredoxin Q/BCP
MRERSVTMETTTGTTIVMTAVATVAMLVFAPGTGVSGDLAIGDRAPDFELPGSDGVTYRLADYRGEKVVVLAWFPKAFTGG